MPAAVAAVIDGSPASVRRDLDHHVRAVDEPPEALGLGGGAFGLVGQARVDLDRDPAVLAVGAVEDRPQDVARPPDVVGHEVADGAVDGDLAHLQVAHLLVVGVALLQGLLEDRRVAGHPDDVLVVDQLLQVAAAQPLAADVVEPDRDALADSSASASDMRTPSYRVGQARGVLRARSARPRPRGLG